MKRSITLIIFLFSFSCNLLFSQTPPYYHYTSSNGLPSSTIYDIIQDKNGYFWIATNKGLSRFNGTRFINYGINDGLNSTTIVSLQEGKDGKIYIGNYLKGINVIENGKISNVTSPSADSYSMQRLFLENENLISYATNSLILYRDSLSTRIISFGQLKDEDESDIITNDVVLNSTGEYFALTSNGIYKGNDFNFQKIKIDGFKNPEIHSLSVGQDGYLYAGGKGYIYVLKDFKLVRIIKTETSDDLIYKIKRDSYGNIWYSVLNKGFRVIYPGTDKIFNLSEKLKIPKAIVNKFVEDNEGNIWVSTFGKGVFCLYNLYIESYSEDDGLGNNSVLAFEKDKSGRLVIGTLNGINILDDGVFRFLRLSENDFVDYIYELRYFDNKIFVSSNPNSYEVSKKLFNNIEFLFVKSPSLYITNDTTFLLGSWHNYFNRSKNLSNIYSNRLFLIGDNAMNNRVNEIFEDSENNVWFGTVLGLVKMSNGKKELFQDNEVFNSTINSIVEDDKKKVWIAGDKGIASYDLKTSVITNYASYYSFDLASSTSLTVDNQKRLWIGNTKGIFILENDAMKHLNTFSGLPSNEVNELFYDSIANIMWVGTSNGFCSIDINEFDKQIKPILNIRIEYIKSGDSVYTKYDGLIFEPDNNNVQIRFSALNYSSPATLRYQYNLGENAGGQWIDTENDFLNFSSMSTGKYKVSVRAKTQNSNWSEPTLVSFTISPGFTETFYFQFLVIGLFTGLIILISKYRINYNKRKISGQLEISQKIDELKFQALSAMMNPHFIFNSLNSVQYLINKKMMEEANDYIAMMAKLIRKNLDTASDSFIYLEDEISRLMLYLGIEKLRFGNKLSFEIKVGNDVSVKSIMIPNMIIQPFVENSIWHGIMQSGNQGKISVTFTFQNLTVNENLIKALVVKITDNGIGLKSGMKNKSSRAGNDHISKGIKIIEDRLKLLSKEINIPQPVYIEDLSNSNEELHGTEVTIYLPPELYRV